MNTQGSTQEVTLDTPGVYDYYCIPHESSGMIGSVIVGQPEPSDQPGLSEPTEVPATTHEKIRSLNGTVIDAIGHSESSDGSDHGTEADHHDTQDGHHG
ncbi:plastocyanin/azurin family copper-binding protein [Halorientalis pallida]|uniref:Blue (type 1) copper domain-containing protein n=1 Tax=Halorientalis pallida TaxID=2479928 RepID=A0A498L5X8_9EURY|nr:plastocyanin/azurin family copper-binding protein [Halorientalis pallida]RXK51135.1 hypothetical protein EAF64_00345 [Halorientalis pallida]